MAILGNRQDTLIEMQGRALQAAVQAVVMRVMEEELEQRIEAVFRERVKKIVNEELARIGISLKDGNLSIRGGGPF